MPITISLVIASVLVIHTHNLEFMRKSSHVLINKLNQLSIPVFSIFFISPLNLNSINVMVIFIVTWLKLFMEIWSICHIQLRFHINNFLYQYLYLCITTSPKWTNCSWCLYGSLRVTWKPSQLYTRGISSSRYTIQIKL